MEIQNLKKRFLEHLEVGLGRSQKTVENYDRALCVFFKYSKITKASEITQDLIHDFRLWLNRRPGTEGTLKKNTQNNSYLVPIRIFLKYVNSQKIKTLAASDIDLAKTETKEESNFFDALVKSGIETKIKDLQTFFQVAQKKEIGMSVWQ